MRSDKPIGDGPTSRGVAQAYILFVVSLGLVLTVGTVLQLTSLGIGLAITELGLILLPALIFVWWKGLPVADSLRLRPVPIPVAMLSILLGITGWGIAAAMLAAAVAVLGRPPNMGLEPRTLPDLLVIYFSGALLAGICEEILFRGTIQAVLRRRGVAWSVLITAVLFGVYHLNPWVILPAIFLGIVMGTLVERTGSIVPAILMHISCNTTAFTVSYLLGPQPDSNAYPLIAVLSALFGVAMVAFWRMTPGSQMELPVLAKIPAGWTLSPVRSAGCIATAVGAFLVMVVVAPLQLVGAYVMSTDELAPDVSKGDRVIVLKQRWIQSEIQPGDIVSFRREGKTLLRKVARCDDTSVSVEQGNALELLERHEITGKVIRVLRGNVDRNAAPVEEPPEDESSRKSSLLRRYAPRYAAAGLGAWVNPGGHAGESAPRRLGGPRRRTISKILFFA